MKGLKREHKQAKQLLVQHKQELDPPARKALRLMIDLTPKQVRLSNPYPLMKGYGCYENIPNCEL